MKSVKNAIVAGAVLAFLVMASSGVPSALAAEGIVGDWEFKSQFGERQMTAKVTFTKNADGTYSGTWVGQRGESKLSDIAVEGNKVKFVRTSKFQDQEFKMSYEGTLEGAQIKGKGSGERGEFDFVADRVAAAGAAPAAKAEAPAAKPAGGMEAVLGQWDMTVTMPQREVTAKLTISKKDDGTLAGTWEAQRGENTISDVKFDAGKLTFTRKSKFQDRETESKFEGTVEGNKLKGKFTSERGEMPAVGTRITANKPEEAKKPEAEKKAESSVVGKWELTTTTQQGTRTRVLIINADMTGTYQMRDGEVPVKDLKVDGNKISFKVSGGSGDQTYEMEFKGEIDGTNLKGEFTTDRGTREVTGKKVG